MLASSATIFGPKVLFWFHEYFPRYISIYFHQKKCVFPHFDWRRCVEISIKFAWWKARNNKRSIQSLLSVNVFVCMKKKSQSFKQLSSYFYPILFINRPVRPICVVVAFKSIPLILDWIWVFSVYNVHSNVQLKMYFNVINNLNAIS